MPDLIPRGTRAVFFDAVGTLLNPDPPAAVVYTDIAKRAGIELAPEVARERFLAAFRAEEEIDRLAGWATDEARELARWRRIVAETLGDVPNTESCFRELFHHFAKPTAWRVNPDASPVMVRLTERGLILGLGSNYDSRLLTVVEGIPELSSLRTRVVVSAAVGFRKPAKEFFREVMAVANCKADELVFVGDDMENDYEGATAAGLYAVLLDAHERHSGDIQRIRELSELIEQLS